LSDTTRRERVSACLIVQDEQHNLPAALDSVSFCDEIVVVDGGSSDRTVEIAHELGASVIENEWPGYAAQRNVALDAATSEWVFELDADERVSADLRASMLALLADLPRDVSLAVCPLRNHFLGKRLGPSAKYPAYRSRMFRRGSYRHDESREVHEGVEPRERPAVLDGDLEHELAVTLGEAVGDAWRYTRLEAAHVQPPRNPAAYLKGILLRPAAKLLYRVVIDGGWRDGWQGAVKILLDATSDALVWTLVLVGAGRRSPRAAESSEANGGEGHFGRRPAGPPKVIATAAGDRATDEAAAWLTALREEGIDVALVSDKPLRGENLPVRLLERLGPLVTMHALDIEMQLRTAHAVVPVGRRARIVHRLLPGALRPEIGGVTAAADPVEAARLARSAVRDRRR
jgi:hypothetical protein